MLFKPYPVKFYPILKERIWGGTKLRSLLHKEVQGTNIGESWELSTVENDISVICNGFYKGKNLQELINEFPKEILGENVFNLFGKQFPLLFKFIDAKEDLSIQVHPNDELAQKRHNSFGKTEMWYIMQADPGARLIIGFKEKVTPEIYKNAVAEKQVVDLLDVKYVKQGDIFYLATGTVHAIGSGVVLAEIQQTSDITYRIYDFDRKDKEGNLRELHTQLAIDAINFDVLETEKNYTRTINKSNPVVNSPYFTTNFILLEDKMILNYDQSTFRVFMCVEGSFQLKFDNHINEFKKGETVLIPACLNRFEISGNASILEIYIS